MNGVFGKMIGSGAVIVAALMPAVLAAQHSHAGTTVRTSPVARYSLMQLIVQQDDISYEDFKARTGAIRSCGEAKNLAKDLNAVTKRNRFTTASMMPDGVHKALKKLPTGHATHVYRLDQSMGVLVLCSRK